MIPKVIHYCWFGGKKKPQSVYKCIQTWKKVMPDYEIREWNEMNVDLKSLPFVEEAYNRRKYAFVSDVVRLQALYDYGGIYLDTDVEVIKRFDCFLQHSAFVSFEGNNSISTAVIGAQKGTRFIKDCLSYYKERHFIQPDGTLDVIPNTHIIAKNLSKLGLVFNDSKQSLFNDYLTVYPITFFSAKQFPSGKLLVTKDTYSIHHFAASWYGKWGKLKLLIHRIIRI